MKKVLSFLFKTKRSNNIFNVVIFLVELTKLMKFLSDNCLLTPCTQFYFSNKESILNQTCITKITYAA